MKNDTPVSQAESAPGKPVVGKSARISATQPSSRERRPPLEHTAEAPERERPDDEPRYRPISLKLVLRLLSWLKPYRGLYTWGVVCGVISVVCELVSPRLVRQIIDVAIPSKEMDQILILAACWMGAMLLALFFDAMQIWATNRCGERVIVDLRMALFDHLQRLSMSFFDKTKLGRILTRGTSDMDAMRGSVINGINTIVLNLLLMFGSGALILYTDWHLFVALAWLIPVLAICNQLYRKRIGKAWQAIRVHFSKMTANLAENITGVRVVSAFNRQDENLNRYNELQDVNTTNNLRAANINGLYQPLLEFLGFAGQVIVLAYGSVLVLYDRQLVAQGSLASTDALTAGQVIQVYFYWGYFMRPTITMGNFYNTLMQTMASAERIFDLMDKKPSVEDRPGAKEVPRLKGHIIFDNITFGYDPERPVLHGIKLEIPAGKTFALVGATGSGKSSMLSLLARFYEFQAGKITVDGMDIREATLRSLHKQMGLVLQVNYLFEGTILDNIRYPRPEATQEEIHKAAKDLGIHDTFMGLPDGYLTQVGERGANISLGLRQLICFTRVLVANPSIFLLDEATSSIDTVTENKIQAALEQLVKGRTTVIVAHRLSTITKADCILVLEHGKIIERGTHPELVAFKGTYAQMYARFAAHQISEEADE